MRLLDSMAARVFALLLVGIVAAAGLAFGVASLQARATAAADREQRLVDRIAAAAAIASATPRGERPQRLGIGPEAPQLTAPAPPATLPPVDEALTQRTNLRLAGLASATVSLPDDGPCPAPQADDAPPPPPLPTPVGRPAPPPPPGGPEAKAGLPAPPPPPTSAPTPPSGSCRWVRLRLANGTALTLIAPQAPRPPSPVAPLGPGPLLLLAVAAAGLAWMVARLATAPISRLAEAAYRLGEDIDRPPLTPSGPAEVRRAAVAFNAMQARLKQGLEERTHMLAAITHDLQTPLTRQRLRLERIDDPDLREPLLADQEAMRALIREGLDLARSAHDGEAMERLDVDSLLDSLAEDAQAAGQAVSVTGTTSATVRTRPLALRRALANLLDNAHRYAGAAELRAEREGSAVVIRVLDRGPGLEAPDLQAMFEPFRRGETSRSRDSGGAGLGLTIAQRLAERCGASLSLHNRPGGGLEARLRLADAPATAAPAGNGSATARRGG